LNDIVDYFVIIEATNTFSGKDKPLFSNNLKELFELHKDKIIHIVVEDTPHKYPNINYANKEQWANEIHQRNCIKRGLDKLNLLDEDFIIIADVDEIPDSTTLQLIKNNTIPVYVNTLEMDLYYYNLNSKLTTKWHSVKIVLYRIFKEGKLTCEDYRGFKCPIIKNGGWHLSYFGDKHFIRNKIQQFSHQEYNNDSFIDLEKIEYRLKNFKDLYDRPGDDIIQILTRDNNYLPINYEKYLSKFITI
jgi:beta-1,4-mannosyl-glycoprotein beta-1,4-N-acetylglucosaminyltransferase